MNPLNLPAFKPYYLPDPEGVAVSPDAQISQQYGGDAVASVIANGGSYQSSNYQKGVSGYYLGSTTAEFNFAISVDAIDIPDTTTANSFHTDNTGNSWWGATTFAAAPAKISNTGAITGSSVTITGGAITGTPIASIPNNSSTDISLLEKTWTMVFSVTDADTIAWTSGTVTLSNGRTFSINSGNTGNMAALTYVYIDPAVSSTALQTTTTAATAMGGNKILVGVAQNNTVTANWIPYGPGQALIDGSQIGALSIVAGNIAASTITAAKMNVSQLSAIAADIGTVTTGVINLSSGTANIHSGQTAYDTGTGFWLEYNSGTPRFSIGNSAGNKMTWDGTNLNIVGGFTASSNAPYFAMTRTAAESISAGNAVCIGPYQSDGGIGYDTDGAVTASNSTTFSVASNSNRMLVVAIQTDTNTVTGVTYNSVAMTQIEGFSYNAGNFHLYIYILPAPATGSHTLTITTSSGTARGFTYHSIYNCNQSTTVDAHSNTTGVDPTATITTVSAGCLVIGVSDGTVISSAVTGTAYFEHKQQTGTSPYAGSSGQVPAAGQSVSISESTSGNSRATCIISIAPITSVSSRLYKASAAASSSQWWNKYQPFMGFAVNTVTVGQDCTVVITGISTQTSLTFPSNYYLSDTAGNIQTSPGTNTRKVGIGVSSTELLVTNIW